MKKKKIYLTKEGYQKLQEELNELLNIKRPQVIAKIKEAREYGDLSENSEYDQARTEQSFIEGKIREIQDILKNAVIIEKNNNTEVVQLGSTVVLESEDGEDVYTIVSTSEADPLSGKISEESAVGKALLGKKVNEKVIIEVPSGTLEYVIKEIR